MKQQSGFHAEAAQPQSPKTDHTQSTPLQLSKTDFMPLQSVDLHDVTVTDPYLRNAGELEIRYLLSFDIDRLLVEFRRNSGLSTDGLKNYGGWESGYDGSTNADSQNQPVRFTGHFVGHYLSALAQAQASTIADGDQKRALAGRLTTLVEGIREAQLAFATRNTDDAGFLPAFHVDALPAGKDGLLVPFYNLHKVEQGLIHAYDYAKDRRTCNLALAAAGDFANFIVAWHTRHPDIDMLSTEYGGMNDALYQLYQITQNPTHLEAARCFDEEDLFVSLAHGIDNLDGKHANATIPKIIGAVRHYLALRGTGLKNNGDTRTEPDHYLEAAERFWDMVVTHHSYANGDNSQSEHFHAADELWSDATQHGDTDGGYRNNSTSETCNAHNMLKLTRLLFQITKDAKYSEYYEHTFINSVLASQHPETGMTTYFQPMKAGYPKIFGTPFGEFWCCQGTGMEGFSKLNDSMYFIDENDIYVNMFRSSVFTDERHGLKITQTAALPEHETITFEIEALRNATSRHGKTPTDDDICQSKLKLRVPRWTTNAMLTVNDGKPQPVSTLSTDETGWLTVPICAGTRIAYTLPARLRSIAAPDNACWTAFQYGPVVLAGVLADTDPLTNYSYAGVMVRMADFDASAHAKSVIKPSRGISASQWLQHLDDNLVRVNGAAPDSSSLHEASSSRPSASPQPSFGPSWSFRFRHVDGAASRIILKPYYSLYRSSYAMYFDIVDQNSPQSIDVIVNDRPKPHAASITLLTYDSVTPDQGNNMEVTAHLRHSENSRSASLSGRTYRDAGPGGWFSYDFAHRRRVDPKRRGSRILRG